MSPRYLRSAYALALLLFCSTAAAADNTVNFNNICLLLKNNALIASGNSCTDYYQCSNGIAMPQSCPNGTYFDKNGQVCLTQSPSYCTPPNTDPCAGAAIGSFVSASDSCSGYYYCSTEGAQRGDCPNDLIFNPTTKACDYSSNFYCQKQTKTGSAEAATAPVNLCAYIQNDIYFGNAFNCAGWQKCKHDSAFTTGSCNNGLSFDTNAAICDYKANVRCSQVSDDPALNVISNSNAGTCTQKGAMKEASTCNKYYVCSNGNWQLQVCSDGLFFDTKTSQCVNRLDAYNNCDRCLGTTKSFVNQFGTNCTGYLFCSNGAAKSSGSCPSGLYFDELMGGCVHENPVFTCCANTTSTASP